MKGGFDHCFVFSISFRKVFAMSRIFKRLLVVLSVAFLFHATYLAGIAFAGGAACTNGGGGAPACVSVATGCSAATPQGTKCDFTGWTSWCECDRNWNPVFNKFSCGCDWLL